MPRTPPCRVRHLRRAPYTRRKVLTALRKLLTQFFVKHPGPPQGLLNNAKLLVYVFLWCRRLSLLHLRSCLPGTDPISGLWPEIGKWEKCRFRPPPENRKKLAVNRKNGPKPIFCPFLGHFSYFSAIFFLFSGGGQNLQFSYFFPISGRRPKWGLYQANRIAMLHPTSFSKRKAFRNPKTGLEGGGDIVEKLASGACRAIGGMA